MAACASSGWWESLSDICDEATELGLNQIKTAQAKSPAAAEESMKETAKIMNWHLPIKKNLSKDSTEIKACSAIRAGDTVAGVPPLQTS